LIASDLKGTEEPDGDFGGGGGGALKASYTQPRLSTNAASLNLPRAQLTVRPHSNAQKTAPSICPELSSPAEVVHFCCGVSTCCACRLSCSSVARETCRLQRVASWRRSFCLLLLMLLLRLLLSQLLEQAAASAVSAPGRCPVPSAVAAAVRRRPGS
jgi:hypothetical protein